MSKFEDFAKLHVAGDPLVLFNAWDAGSAAAVAKSGAKAIATGSASVVDGQRLRRRRRKCRSTSRSPTPRGSSKAVELPVTVDFEGGYATDPARLTRQRPAPGRDRRDRLQFRGPGRRHRRLYDIADQAERIAALRAGVGDDFFINLRTDLFLKAKPRSA